MKSAWTIWLLAGALAASLHWNLRQARPADDGQHAAPAAATAASAPSCTIALEDLDLSAEQTRRLDELCGSACEGASDDTASAESKLDELRQALSSARPEKARLDALVREICALRERSLTTCVDSILAVRAILDADQLEKLEASCQPGACELGAGAR